MPRYHAPPILEIGGRRPQDLPKDMLNKHNKRYKAVDKFAVKWCPTHNGAWQISKGRVDPIKDFPRISCQDKICPACNGDEVYRKKYQHDYWERRKANK